MKCLVAITCLLALSASSKGDGLYGNQYAPGYASVDYYAYPSYAFEYAVRDPHTGDNKAQWEKRDGDVVRGAYSLVEPDGSLRVVEYRADDKSGFNAVVKRIGPNLHPASAPIYKAPLPVIGYKSEIPISVGPVAGLEKLASAPLLNGAYSGGLASSYSSLYKAPTPSIIKEVIPAPILKEPIIPLPIIKEPIVPYPILKEPYLPIYKQPIIKEPYYPIYKQPIIKEPYYPIYKQPIYNPASILKEEIYPESYPIYPSYSAIKGPLLPYGGYDLNLLGKGLLGDKGLGLYNYKGYGDHGSGYVR
ncbi:actin cytoskeleton-regulatory complex protein PAN1-like [Maniola jurtina]|uniref:actin cytoskeleton-regulatory complex protein PAN1-like n=1 Tax=Maniola jurtina TaxID=191418 RepID=UPI001E68D193|nr:actin cytoskeleton-regulatory complex protein PAN1-like [Maniola jurtina]